MRKLPARRQMGIAFVWRSECVSNWRGSKGYGRNILSEKARVLPVVKPQFDPRRSVNT
jgi:hypothetical protein